MPAFSLCSVKSQLWQMQDREAAAVLVCSPVSASGTACALGMGKGGTLLSLTSVCSLGVGTESPQTGAQTVFLASEDRDLAESVKRGSGHKT